MSSRMLTAWASTVLVASAVLMVLAVTRPAEVELVTHQAVVSGLGRVDLDPVSGSVEELRLDLRCAGIGTMQVRVGVPDPDGQAVGAVDRIGLVLELADGEARLFSASEGGEVLATTFDPTRPGCVVSLRLDPDRDEFRVDLESEGVTSRSFPGRVDTRSISFVDVRTVAGESEAPIPSTIEADVVELEEARYSRGARSIRRAAVALLLVGLLLWWRAWPDEPGTEQSMP